MKKRKGYILLHKKIFDHKHFKKESFTPREAFIWMLCSAVYEEYDHRINGRPILLERGQLSYSYRFLAEAWLWKRGRVERFIKQLKNETLIETETKTGQMVISVCNYNKYQQVEKENETETGHQTEQERDRSETNTNKTKTILNNNNTKYAFSGKIIKLNQEDYDKWTSAYPSVDLNAELTALDDYYSAESNVGNWFIRASKHLANTHSKNKQKEDNNPTHPKKAGDNMSDKEWDEAMSYGLND